MKTKRMELFAGYQPANVASYGYDAAGNRQQVVANGATTAYSANALNQYTSISGPGAAAPIYDLDGNTTSLGGYTLSWDGENRLTKLVPSVASTGVRRISYAYDALSRRRSKSVEAYNGTSWVGIKTSFYRYQGWNVLSETVLLPTISDVYHFYWGRDVSGSLQGAGGVGGLVAFYHGTGDRGYYHYDGNGNVTELSDLGTGEAIARYRYDAFGQLTSLNGTLVADDNTYRFSTKPIDAELNAPAGSQLGQGLYYYGYRFYSPAGGRWVNRDPVNEVGGINLYAFCSNDPETLIDKLGNKPKYPGTSVPPGYKQKDDQSGGVDPIEDPTPFPAGKDANGKCKPCPGDVCWEAKNPKPGEHGSKGNTHYHSVTWSQVPLGQKGSKNEPECTCIPNRNGHPSDPRKEPNPKKGIPKNTPQIPGTY